MSEPMNLTEPVRCALAMHDAGYVFKVEPEDVAALLAAYDRLAAQPSWQSIETAPKDGTRIVVCMADRYPKNTYVARWLKGNWEITPLGEWCAYPTHWMPLPDAPAPLLTPARGGGG